MASQFLSTVSLLLSFATLGDARPAAQPGTDEAARVRILLVLDTDDRQGATWGQDGDNMRGLLDGMLKREQLAGRFTLEVLTGPDVTPQRILDHYRRQPADPSQTLLFYYSGHGGWHARRGHFLALHRGPLYRSDLGTAMAQSKPRLQIMLTDCCSNLAAGAYAEEPAAVVLPLAATGLPGPGRKAKREEPTATVSATVRPPGRRPDAEPPRPEINAFLKVGHRALCEEPAFIVVSLKAAGPDRKGMRARKEEPPAEEGAALLRTGAGGVQLREVIAKSDGKVMRDLLFRQRGLVDINGSTKGAPSFGRREWGGSLFTNAFIALQLETVAKLDANHDQVVEWTEFFPVLQRLTDRAAHRVSDGKLSQVPEAYHLPGK
jgi:hypothetical protein